jgi:hypothetical protein
MGIGGQNYIDSREVDEEINRVSQELSDKGVLAEDDPDFEYLQQLEQLRDDVNHPYWESGLTLILRESFEEYAVQLAEDVTGCRMTNWPFHRIDWELACADLEADFKEVTFQGDTYLYRS